MDLPLLILGLFLIPIINGCNLCAPPPLSPSSDCPSGSICDNSLISKQSLPTGCVRYRCASGNLLAKKTSNLQRQIDYLWCSTTRVWYDNLNRTGYAGITCILNEDDGKCSYPPLPEPIPEGYKVMGTAVYNKTSRVLKCTVPSAILITQSKIGLGTKPDGCLHVESAMCADVFRCNTDFLPIDSWGSDLQSVYSGPPFVNTQDFTLTCPSGKQLRMESAIGDKLSCVDGNWIQNLNGVPEIVSTNKIGCFAEKCTPIEASTSCGEGKQCSPAEYVTKMSGGEYACKDQSAKLVFVTNGKTKIGATLKCGQKGWMSDGEPVTECSAVRCEADKCPSLEAIENNAIFTRDYKGLPVVREGEDKYSCPPVQYESSLQQYVDYTYDLFVEDDMGEISKAGKYLTCGQNGQKWGWRSNDGIAIEANQRVFCGLRNCQFCVSQSLTNGCSGLDKASHNKSLVNGCSVSFYSCPSNKVLRTTDQGPNPNYKSAPQPFTCQSSTWNTYKATYGVGTAKTACCDTLVNACSVKSSETCTSQIFDCQLPSLDQVSFTLTCPTGYVLFDKTTPTVIHEQSAKCSMNDYEWYTTTANKKLSIKTKQFFCKKL